MKNELYIFNGIIKFYLDDDSRDSYFVGSYDSDDFQKKIWKEIKTNNKEKALSEYDSLKSSLHKEYSKVAEIFANYIKTIVIKHDVEGNKILKKYE